MIPVREKPEPPDFDEKVRKPGVNWLKKKNISPDGPPPKSGDLPNYWRETQKALWDAYHGVCAYLAIFFEWPLGSHSTDHFIAKSSNAGQAYEWSNYRLSCLGANRNKHKFDDVLDPFEIQDETFVLNLLTGKIKPGPNLSDSEKSLVLKTIKRLKLNSEECKEMRARRYGECIQGNVSEDYLKRHSPFIWYEANRQKLL